MKRLLLAALFGVSFALHDWTHAQVSAPQHELCAVSATTAHAPEPQPQVVAAAGVSQPLLVAAQSVVVVAAPRSAPARAPPSFLLG